MVALGGLVAAAAAAIAYGAASLLQSLAASRGASTAHTLVEPRYLAGLALDGAAWLLSLVALQTLPVYEVQAVLAGSLAVTAVLARVVLGARLRRSSAGAIGVTVAALAVLVLASDPGAGGQVGSRTRLWVALSFVPVLAAGAAAARRASAGVVAGAAGLAFGGAALAARCVDVPSDLTTRPTSALVGLAGDPAAWAVPAFGLLGVVLYAHALGAGAVGPVTAVLWIVEVTVPAVASVTVLGDRFRPGWLLAALVSLAAAVAAAGVLAVSTAPPPPPR